MDSGERIQKVFSRKGILSRRKTEEAIKEKRILINGQIAKLGQGINTRRDTVTLDGKPVPLDDRVELVYYMLNKPRGYVTTTQDQHDRRTVMELIKSKTKVYPIGRLDLESEGLLLFTNDGQFANQIMHPSGEVSKIYRVTIRGPVTEEKLVHLSSGVLLDDGYKTQPSIVHVLEKFPQRTVLQISVIEGKNRLIRRMMEGVGLELIRLKRTHIGPLKLGMLQPGKFRELTPAEVHALRGSVRKARNRSQHELNAKRSTKDNEKGNARSNTKRITKRMTKRSTKDNAKGGK